MRDEKVDIVKCNNW